MSRIVVGISGGVTSAWSAGWALRNYPKSIVDFVHHDTKVKQKETIEISCECGD